ncbi:MAG: hypothetical protein EAX81_05930 [Candidatus Thorarchaeota archaeon]|nr:hypothetical protein [Candidatus Thorarchaeota archaeon]
MIEIACRDAKMMWESEDWLTNPIALLKWANGLEKGPALLLIRHSQRLEPREAEKILEEPLTSLGIQMAEEFGRRLDCDKVVSIWHSHHMGAQQTAEGIVRGLMEKGRLVHLRGPNRTLLGPGWDAPKYMTMLKEMGLVPFFDSWARDRIPIEIIEPIGDFTQKLVVRTIGRIMGAPEESLHIHITHDLVVMAARKVFLDIDTTDENRVSYLGGFGIARSNDLLVGFLDYNQKQTWIGPS